jgi:hypothetical protein
MATNITVYDGIGYYGTGQGWEDNETEPGNVLSQAWDLEGFFLKGSELSMIGGYDFVEGEYSAAWKQTFYSGDIFISTDSDFFSGNTGTTNHEYEIVESNFGYEYAIDLDFQNKSYKIVELNDSSTVMLGLAYFDENIASNPFRYVSGGSLIGTGSFIYNDGADVSNFGFTDNDTHNLVSGIDLSFMGT